MDQSCANAKIPCGGCHSTSYFHPHRSLSPLLSVPPNQSLGGDPVSSPPFQNLSEVLGLSKSTIVINGDLNITKFPFGHFSNFSNTRNTHSIPFFDRTRYIPTFGKINAVVSLRPRRFGKSLTLSMLSHFYGVEHKAFHGHSSRFRASHPSF